MAKTHAHRLKLSVLKAALSFDPGTEIFGSYFSSTARHEHYSWLNPKMILEDRSDMALWSQPRHVSLTQA